jgi:CheY-like chemotaxis protein
VRALSPSWRIAGQAAVLRRLWGFLHGLRSCAVPGCWGGDSDSGCRRQPSLPTGSASATHAASFEVVNAVADGEEALAAVIHACPDGVLLDVNLPGRDGYAVAASLAAACPAARIVLTSSDVEGLSTAVLDDCGATAFVPKTELAIVDLGRLFSGGGYGRLDERETVGPSGT